LYFWAFVTIGSNVSYQIEGKTKCITLALTRTGFTKWPQKQKCIYTSCSHVIIPPFFFKTNIRLEFLISFSLFLWYLEAPDKV